MGTLEGFWGFVMLIVILITINIILWTSEFQKEKRKNEGEKSEDEKKAEELLYQENLDRICKMFVFTAGFFVMIKMCKPLFDPVNPFLKIWAVSFSTLVGLWILVIKALKEKEKSLKDSFFEMRHYIIGGAVGIFIVLINFFGYNAFLDVKTAGTKILDCMDWRIKK